MCGIVGFIDTHTRQDNRVEITHMMDALSHRGPDDEGFWLDDKGILALGFRRLAILDLSPNGHQPMISANNQFSMVFNGEVYNFQELRTTLEERGYSFRGGSDSEVMLAAFCEWGVAEAVKKFNGMFAIALWNRGEEHLYLIRDRVGVKPLYYGWHRGNFYFASELKALRAHSDFHPEIDQYSLGQFFKYGYVPAPNSIYTNIYKLTPGSILKVSPRKPENSIEPKSYWELPRFGEKIGNAKFRGNDEDALVELETILKESVRLRMIADVPLGAFLSGGVDSSTIVALMQAQSSRPIKTFTIGFREKSYNEAVQAKEVASHLGTEHTELYVTPQEAMAVIPKLPNIYDEPFADPSQIPTFLVSKLARREVTVSLSGDGGDELFLGYNRYYWGQRIWASVGWLPRSTKAWFAKMFNAIPILGWDSIYGRGANAIPRKLRLPNFGDKLQKLSAILVSDSPDEVYERLITFWQKPSELLLSEGVNNYSLPSPNGHPSKSSFWEWMSRLDIHTYLPDDILVKLDRASMAVSLEARVPLLDDHRVVEFACSLPYSMKYRNGKSKWLLRRLVYKYIPPQLLERPKMGFGVPIDKWLRAPLRKWADSLLDPHQIQSDGLLNSDLIQAKWKEHLSGTRNWHYHLWNVLMFQAWLHSDRARVVDESSPNR